MDTKTLIANLRKIFCDTNQAEKKYSEVWLSEVDFGGMYDNGKYVLNVKAEHQIDNCNKEIKDILKLLDEKAKEELVFIWRVDVYNSNEMIHCQSDDIVVYTEELACN